MGLIRAVGVQTINESAAGGPTTTTRKLIPDASWRAGDLLEWAVCWYAAVDPVVPTGWTITKARQTQGGTFSYFVISRIYSTSDRASWVGDNTFGWTITISPAALFTGYCTATPKVDQSNGSNGVQGTNNASATASATSWPGATLTTTSPSNNRFIAFYRDSSGSSGTMTLTFSAGITKIGQSIHNDTTAGAAIGVAVGEYDGNVQAAGSVGGGTVTSSLTISVYGAVVSAVNITDATVGTASLTTYRKVGAAWVASP